MDLNRLFLQHSSAWQDHADAPTAEARRWAGECADYFATRIVDEREQRGIPVRMFGRSTAAGQPGDRRRTTSFLAMQSSKA